MTASYVTPLELARFLKIDGGIPDKSIVSKDRTDEEVGTGNNETTRYFLDHAYIIGGSYSLRAATSEAVSGTALVEGEHYIIDKDNGEINLNSAGTAILAETKIYASYEYTKVGLTNTELQEALNRAEDEFIKRTNNYWCDGATATPNWRRKVKEEQKGKGNYNRQYFLQEYPVPDIKTSLNGTTGIGDGTIIVDSTDGFPSSGTAAVESDKFYYSGKTGTAFTGVTALTSEHASGKEITPYVIEISTTCSGSEPVFTTLNKDTDYDIDLQAGRVFIYRDDIMLDALTVSNPPNLIPNRFRATYIHGHGEIPERIKHGVLMKAAQDILHTVVRKAHTSGNNDFNPDLINVDKEEIDRIIMGHKNWKVKNI